MEDTTGLIAGMNNYKDGFSIRYTLGASLGADKMRAPSVAVQTWGDLGRNLRIPNLDF